MQCRRRRRRRLAHSIIAPTQARPSQRRAAHAAHAALPRISVAGRFTREVIARFVTARPPPTSFTSSQHGVTVSATNSTPAPPALPYYTIKQSPAAPCRSAGAPTRLLPGGDRPSVPCSVGAARHSACILDTDSPVGRLARKQLRAREPYRWVAAVATSNRRAAAHNASTPLRSTRSISLAPFRPRRPRVVCLCWAVRV